MHRYSNLSYSFPSLLYFYTENTFKTEILKMKTFGFIFWCSFMKKKCSVAVYSRSGGSGK